jgi:septal ring factor EnvC (AmiA/AmiB activator)
MENLLLSLVFAELIGVVFLLIKAFPTLQTKVASQQEEINAMKTNDSEMLKTLNSHSLELMETRTEMIAFKKDFEESKKSNNEIHKELRKALEDVTRAVISLEVTLKHFNERLEKE